MDCSIFAKETSVLLIDIEGTTTPISFVANKLFPFIKEQLDTFLYRNWYSDEVLLAIEKLKEQVNVDVECGMDSVPRIVSAKTRSQRSSFLESVKKNVLWQMSQDRKTTALKYLQGLMWREAYYSGKIKGEVFMDVKVALEKLQKQNFQIFIYSSGSVEAQKLLFKYSEHGNMLPLFDGHFDTTIGSKREKESYQKIAENISCKLEQILFLTDVLQEADAAFIAGLHVCIVVRPGNKPLEKLSQYPCIKTFKSLV